MNKISLVSGCMVLFFLIIGCAKENAKGSIKINTEKTEYVTDEMIYITITNKLNHRASHFKCDNVDLKLSHILKYEFGTWTEEEQFYWCTQMGLTGFHGGISPSQTKYDSVEIETMGTYKLKYTFIISSDTTYYLSNEFKIIN